MADPRKYIKPSERGRKLNDLLARLGTPALTIPGRKSGVLRITAVLPITVGGKKYVVSPRGESDWVRNLRAAGHGELRRAWLRQPFTAVEVDGPEREKVIATYRRRYGLEVNQYFNQLPELDNHPTFRLES